MGDAVVDVLAGKAAGMRTVAVTWGSGEPEGLAQAEPDYIFDSIERVADLLAGEPAEA